MYLGRLLTKPNVTRGGKDILHTLSVKALEFGSGYCQGYKLDWLTGDQTGPDRDIHRFPLRTQCESVRKASWQSKAEGKAESEGPTI